MAAIGLVLAAIVGLSLGLLGGGGSILTVPIFVYVLGYDAKTAIAVSLPIIGITSLAGVVNHWRAGNVNIRVALMFGAVAMVGAFVGARLAQYVSGPVQLTLLSIVMLAAAIAMFRGGASSEREVASAHTEPALSLGWLLGVALGVGVLTGVVGIGGGFLVVPALVLLAQLPMKQAVGTSLFVIAMNSAAGFAGYVGRVVLPWQYASLFALVAVGGILVGSSLVRHVPATALKRGFAVFLLVIALIMLYQNRATFSF